MGSNYVSESSNQLIPLCLSLSVFLSNSISVLPASVCGFILSAGSPQVGRKMGSEQPRFTSSQASLAERHVFLSKGPLGSVVTDPGYCGWVLSLTRPVMRGILQLFAPSSLDDWVEVQPDRSLGMHARQTSVVTTVYSE